jgi:hypothetical protein
MIFALESAFSTQQTKNLSSGMRSQLAIRTPGYASGERSSFGHFPFNRAVGQQRVTGSLWNPRLLDSLTVPLTRHHE